MSDIGDKVLAVLRETKPEAAAKLGLDARLEEDLGFTSLDLTEIVFAIEDAFGITVDFDASTARRFQTVRDVVASVEDVVARKG
jgi:acyl carrier protein